MFRMMLSLVLVLCFEPAFIFANGRESQFEDGSFENAELGSVMPSGWHLWQPEDGHYDVSVVESGHSGSRCVQLQGTGSFGTFNSMDVAIKEGDCFLAGAWIRLEGESGASAHVKLHVLKADGSYLTDRPVMYFNASTMDWSSALMISEFDRIPEAATFRLVVVLHGTGKIWIDDVSLVKIGHDSTAGLLRNGDMELSHDNALAGWSVNEDPTATSRIAVAKDEAHEGVLAMNLVGQGAWASANSQIFEVDVTKSCVCTGWIKVKSGSAAICINYWSDNRWLGAEMAPMSNPREWTKLSVTADFEKHQNITHVSVFVSVNGPSFDVLADDLIVRQE